MHELTDVFSIFLCIGWCALMLTLFIIIPLNLTFSLGGQKTEHINRNRNRKQEKVSFGFGWLLVLFLSVESLIFISALAKRRKHDLTWPIIHIMPTLNVYSSGSSCSKIFAARHLFYLIVQSQCFFYAFEEKNKNNQKMIIWRALVPYLADWYFFFFQFIHT